MKIVLITYQFYGMFWFLCLVAKASCSAVIMQGHLIILMIISSYLIYCPRFWAKTRGGTLEAPAYGGNVVYSPEGKGTRKSLDFLDLGPQINNETLAKDLQHARKGLTTRLKSHKCIPPPC